MGVDFDYRSDQYLGIDELLRVQERVKEQFSGYIGFSKEQTNHAYLSPDSLPVLHERGGVVFHKISTNGFLPLKKEPWEAIRDIIENGANSIGQIGLLMVTCGFEEKTSKQTKRAFDTVRIRIEKGRRYFSYRANGSRVSKLMDYRKAFMSEIIEKLGLPLQIIEEDENFLLSHTLAGDLRILKGLFGKNPAAFICEIPGASLDTMVGYLHTSVKEFASTKRFEYSWTADHTDFSNPDLSKRIYEVVCSANFPAESYYLDIEFGMDDISGIEVIKTFCGPEDEVYTRLCSFDLSERDHGEFSVVSKAKGHRLYLKLTHAEYHPMIERIFNMEFKEIK